MTEVAVVGDVAAAASELFIESVAGAAAARGRAAVALTGGSTASPLYARLRTARLPWAQTHVFFTDERAVPPDHELSNDRLERVIALVAEEVEFRPHHHHLEVFGLCRDCQQSNPLARVKVT